MRETLLELQRLIIRAAELSNELPRGYREDQIKAALTGTNGEVFGDGIPDWIEELLKKHPAGDCEYCGEDFECDCEGAP